MFDPYYKWLGIRPEHQPPDHYRLLGLERFENDPDVIRAAGERQMAHVQSYKLGHMADLSQRVLNEIARAKVCLLNPMAKSGYDQQLRRAMAPHAAPPDGLDVGRSAELTLVDPEHQRIATQVAFGNTTRKAISRRKKTGVSVTIGATGILLAIILGAIVTQSLEDSSHAKARVANPTSKPEGKSPLPKPEVPTIKGASSPRTRRYSPPAAKIPPTHATQLPIPSTFDQDRAKKKIQGLDKLSPTQLLYLGNTDNDPAARYVLRQMAIELEIQLAAYDTRTRSWIAPAAVDALIKEFYMPANFKDEVNRRLEVAMSAPQVPDPGATEPEAPPRHNEPNVNPKRAIVKIDAPLLDLSKNQYLIPIEMPLDGVEPKDLKIEGIQLGTGRAVQRFPTDGIARHGKPVRLVVRNTLPKAGVELSLHGVESLYVKVKPIVEDYDNKLYPWSQERMKKLEAVLTRTAKECDEAIATLKVQIPLLRGQLDALRKVQRNAYNQEAVALEQGQAEAAVAASQNRLEQLQRQSPVLQTQIQGFEELFKLSESVHRNARITFRVFHDAGGKQVEIAESN